MKSKATLGIFFLVITLLYYMGTTAAYGQRDLKAGGKAGAGKQKEKEKKDSNRVKEEKRKVRADIKERRKKSTDGIKEQAENPHEVSLENGRVNSTLPVLSEVKNLKQTNQKDKPNNSGGIFKKFKRQEIGKQGLFKKALKEETKTNRSEAGGKRSENSRFKKQGTKMRYLDSLLHLSDLGNQKEFASLLNGQLPAWVDGDMMSSAKTQGNKLVRVHSDKTLHQVEDTVNHYFPARKLLMIAQKKEEISPADFVGLLGNNKGEEKGGIMGKDIPANEGGAKSALLKNAGEEIKDISSYRLPEEHLATLKALQARQVGNLPKEILDSLRKAGMRKNAIKMKEADQSKTERLNKIQEKGRLRYRFFFEGIMGGFNNDFTTFQISPALGFKVFKTYSVGVGPILTINRIAKSINTILDVRVFMKKEFFEQRCYLQVEDIMRPYSREKGYNFRQALYVGGGYIFYLGQKVNLNVMALYQVAGAKIGGPFILRVGFSLVNKAEKK